MPQEPSLSLIDDVEVTPGHRRAHSRAALTPSGAIARPRVPVARLGTTEEGRDQSAFVTSP